MIITNEIDYEWDIDNKFSCAGFPERNRKTVQSMQPGDKIVYYVTKISRFTACVDVIGESYYSDECIWDDPYDVWPCRVKTKPIKHCEDASDGIYIKDIWDNLEFIKNKVKWGSQVQGSLRKISEHDYNVICDALKM